MTTTLELGAVHINANNIEKLKTYYESLGFESETSEDTVLLKAAGETLVVLHPTNFSRRHEVGLYHFAVLLPSRADLGNFVYHISKSRIPATGASDHHVSEAIYFSDPEGNGIEIYHDRPESEWKVEGRVHMDTLAMDVEGVLNARTSDNADKFPAGTKMGHVHLHVLNLDESEDFYKKTLGFDKILDYPMAGFYSRDGYHHHVGMNMWLKGNPKKKEDGYPGLRFYTIYLESGVFSNLFGDEMKKVSLRDPNNILIKVIKGFKATYRI